MLVSGHNPLLADLLRVMSQIRNVAKAHAHHLLNSISQTREPSDPLPGGPGCRQVVTIAQPPDTTPLSKLSSLPEGPLLISTRVARQNHYHPLVCDSAATSSE